MCACVELVRTFKMKLPFVSGMVVGCLSTAGLISFRKLWYGNSEASVEDYQVVTDTVEASPVSLSLEATSESQLFEDENSRTHQVLAFGWPRGGRILRKLKNHVLEYDCGRRIPMWVSEHLTASSLKGKADRQAAKFKMDPLIPVDFSAQNSDYKGSGWSRGHMSPAGDNKMSQECMDETFYLTNIVPQDIENNAGFWNRLEIFCRDLTQKYNDVWITSGPLFLPTKQEDGKKIVSYEVIGDNEVAVPTHLYKIIVANDGDNTVTGSFIVPNKPIDYSHHLREFQVPMDNLERKVGVKFYDNLNRVQVRDLCEDTGCHLMTKTQMDLFIYSQRLKRANNLKKLTKIWKEMQEKEIPVDVPTKDLFQKRLLDFSKEDSCLEHGMPAVQTTDVPPQEGTRNKPIPELVESAAVLQQAARVGASG